MNMVEQDYHLKNEDISDDMWSAMTELRHGQSRYGNPFFSVEFARIMSSVRNDLNMFIGEDKDGMAYFWPLHLSFLRRTRGVGGPFSDRNGPVSREGYHLDIPGLFARHNIESLTAFGLCHTQIQESPAFKYVATNGTDLSGGYDNFLAHQIQLHSSHYKQLRRLGRKLDRDFIDVEFRFDDRRDKTYEHLIAMKRKQFCESGKHDVLRPDWVTAMFAALRSQDNPTCQTRLSSLYVDGKFVAGELNLQGDSVLHGWIVAYDKTYSKYSPGNLLTQFILENMSRHGMTYYDSGTGGDHYKKYVTNHQEWVGVGVVNSAAMIPTTRQILGKAWNAAEQVVPQKVSSFLSSTRRRSEQILATEINMGSRLRGYYEALNSGKMYGAEENS